MAEELPNGTPYLSPERTAELEDALRRPTCEIARFLDDRVCVAEVGHAITCLQCHDISMLCCEHYNLVLAILAHGSARNLVQAPDLSRGPCRSLYSKGRHA